MKVTEEEYLAHYGILRKSGRYPWGSGMTQNQRNKSFLDTIEGHRKDGIPDPEIAKMYGMSSTELRRLKSIARSEQKQARINQAVRLQDKGLSNVAIGKAMGINESSVRALLESGAQAKADELQNISAMLKREVDKKTFLDIGIGVERSLPLGENPAAHIGVSKDKFQTAVTMLKEQGYVTEEVKIRQVGTGEMTTRKALMPPGYTQKDLFLNRDKIQLIQEKSEDGGKTFEGLRPATSMSSKRLAVNYAEDGGSKADGVMYIRPGAKDLDMGGASYAQVRIMVDGTHYLKGMAVYKDDLPAGKDIVFNTNKKRGTPLKHDDPEESQVLKPATRDAKGNIDLMRPFGAEIKAGGQRGHLNIINEEGDWDKWSKNLPSQMLSKQKPELAKEQLAMTYERRRKELNDILELTNPTIKKKLLDTFAEETDSAAVHLKAAAIPNQATKVILPVNSVKEHEVYAPTFRNGERLALVRFPHGGTFEIPEVTVNNRNPEAKKLFGTGGAKDAIGINHKVAERLSGADFDGDHVLAIPNNQGKIKSTPPLQQLKDFDPKRQYPKYPGMIPIDAVKGRDQKEMGQITNLIADMSIKGANDGEIAQAVRHSMVVIDAKKHQLDYKQSYIDNGIPALKAKYQGSARAGASTLITKATSEVRVLDRKARSAKEGGPIDAEGRLQFVPSGKMRKDRDGNLVPVMRKSQRLAEEDNAHALVSEGGGTRVERIYADHSNRLKALANETRKHSAAVPRLKYNESSAKIYKNEVASLNSQLNTALKNAPLERQAQGLAQATISQKTRNKPDMEKEERRKISNHALAEARARTGAGKTRIKITEKEWAAIQAGAISDTKLRDILKNTDVDRIRELATPRTTKLMTSAKLTRAKSMLASGATQREVADALGVSLTTLKEGLK